QNSFTTVAHAIEQGHIHLHEGGVPQGVAVYNRWHNRLSIGVGGRQSRIFEALIIHEAVHAFFDRRHISLPEVDSEAAGYIAQGCYLRTSNFDRNRLGQSENNEVLTGMLIADGIAARHGVSTVNLNELRASLFADNHYRRYINGTFAGNG
ncbi:MAG: hypothetical protein ACRD43_03435, partial [Pyrinomonadaceae bacterium]